MDKKKLIAGIILIGLGIGMFALGFTPKNSEITAEIDSWKRVSKEGIEAQGTLASTESVTRTEGTRRNRKIVTAYCNVYEFTADSKTYTAKAVGDDCKETRDEAQKTTTATIAYDQADPATAFVKSDATVAYYKDTDSRLASVIFGTVLVLIGIFGIRSARPKTPEQLATIEEKRRKAQEEYEKVMADIAKKQEAKKAQKQQK
ncbi:MAG TPA: DUF3592 domain-containing protein [Candidatus Saccharibacteria bacterium]|nr:DUF3592 domain-containing protein [Candidatus Saccharibacteria bacterium]